MSVYIPNSKVLSDITSVEEINDTIETVFKTSGQRPLFTNNEFSEMIQRYRLKIKEGIGVVFVAITYDKRNSTGVHYAVFFDIASRTVLISQRYETSPGGTGIRNYWAYSIYQAMKLLSKSYTKKWVEKYGD